MSLLALLQNPNVSPLVLAQPSIDSSSEVLDSSSELIDGPLLLPPSVFSLLHTFKHYRLQSDVDVRPLMNNHGLPQHLQEEVLRYRASQRRFTEVFTTPVRKTRKNNPFGSPVVTHKVSTNDRKNSPY